MSAIVLFLEKFWPYITAFFIGAAVAGGAAWKVQGLRIESAKQEFSAYKLKEQKAAQDAKDKADKAREEAAKQYQHLSEKLDDEINSGVVYRRCVAAGKCGVRTVYINKPGVPASTGTNAASADAIPAGQVTATEIGPEVVTDCAITTLRLNALQEAIENQPGY